MSFWGPIIGAGIATAGSMFTNKRNIAASRAATQSDRAWQQKLLQNQIQWRMQDARAAGVSPAVALGGSVVGSGTSAPTPQIQNELHHMGQGVSRAMTSMLTPAQKSEQNLRLENMKLQNDLLKTQVAGSIQSVKKHAQPPTFPATHTSDNWPTSDVTVSELPMSTTSLSQLVERALTAVPKTVSPKVSGTGGNPNVVAGHIPGYTHMRTSDGYTVLPSKDAKDLVEDILPLELLWVGRAMSTHEHKPPYPAKPGFRWEWNPISLTWKHKRIPRKVKRLFGNDRFNIGIIHR